MPELPEVETMRRGILGAVGGTICGAEKVPCPRKPIAIKPTIGVIRRKILGKKITAIDRIGKRVVVRIEPDLALILEPRMTGLVLVTDPPSREHLRFQLEIEDAEIHQILFWDRRGLGNVRLLNPKQMNEQLGPDKIGPDALKITRDQFRERLNVSQREIKVALLDQKVLAGVGNLYASEMLFQARIHPQKKCSAVSKRAYDLLFDAMQEILERAIRYEGSTLSDGTYRNALNEDGGFQNEHQVYDREGTVCPSCHTSKICRIVQAQRATFYCKRCQKK